MYDEDAAAFVARNRNHQMPRPFEAMALHMPAGGLIVDIGAGPGWHTLEWQRRGRRAIALDLSRGLLDEAQALGVAPLLLADMRRLPLADACADGLWVCASFLHVPRADAPATLREFARVLKMGGALYIGVKGGSGEKFTLPIIAAPRYFVFWEEQALDDALRDAGFTIVEAWNDAPEAKATRAAPWINRVAVRNR
ncbi:MAG: class I SAM-dependent methyltransferase [Chloroflexi bacterium]|nr:class I SAM-dependent methyltransferase [Chloroflexota bacterium]